jgi:hypothetical protein
MLSYDLLLVFSDQHLHLIRFDDISSRTAHHEWSYEMDEPFHEEHHAFAPLHIHDRIIDVAFTVVDRMVDLRIPLDAGRLPHGRPPPTDLYVSSFEPPQIISNQLTKLTICSVLTGNAFAEDDDILYVDLSGRETTTRDVESRWLPDYRQSGIVAPLSINIGSTDYMRISKISFDEWSGKVILPVLRFVRHRDQPSQWEEFATHVLVIDVLEHSRNAGMSPSTL